jgi:hypothetical protein
MANLPNIEVRLCCDRFLQTPEVLEGNPSSRWVPSCCSTLCPSPFPGFYP